MKAELEERLKKVTTFVFDVDGVMTDGTVVLHANGDQARTTSVRDGYAIKEAMKKGFAVCIITGGSSLGVEKRLAYLGVGDVFTGVENKLQKLNEYCLTRDIAPEQILYMGDDFPDYESLLKAGISTCPNDADPEIQKICDYISPLKGGEGCVREVIQKTLLAQKKWRTPIEP